jgi:regulatory protein
MLVTKLSNPSRKGLVAVYARAEGQRAAKIATLDQATIERLAIAPGSEWTDQLAASALEASARFTAKQDAVAVLTRAPTTRKRLLERLARKGHAPDAASQAADWCAEHGLINDETLAAAIATSAARTAGRRAVEAKLRRKGVSQETARSAAKTADTQRSARAAATKLAKARAQRMDKLDAPTRKRRLYAFLARKGFDHDDIARALAAALGPSGHAQD